MSDQHTPSPGEPGHESQPGGVHGQGQRSGADRRVSPGAPEPGTNQQKTEPAGAGNVSPGTGSSDTSGDDAGATYGLATHAMPGTSEAAAPAQGVRRGVPEIETDGPATKVEAPVADRRTGSSGPGSAAAAQGETPQPHVEQTHSGDPYPGAAHERPVTNAHRPGAPSGEVGSQ